MYSDEPVRAKSMAALRLSEHIARLGEKPCDVVEVKSPAAATRKTERVEFDLDSAVNARAKAKSFPAVKPKRAAKKTMDENLTDAIEAELVLNGSMAEGDLLKAIARRLSDSSSKDSNKSRSSSIDDTAGSVASDKPPSRFSRFSNSLRRSVSKGSSDKSVEAGGAAEASVRKASISKTVGGSVTCRYCLDSMPPTDNCSSCMCNGFLCQSCLEGELQLTFSRGNRVMHCTVCRHVFTISDMKEVRLPVPRFPRCHTASGECMRTSVVLPLLMWTMFTSIYSFLDPDFEVVRGDVFFIAELATMAFALHFCWKSSELTRDWLRFLYFVRAVRSLVVIIVWAYTWIDTIFLIFSVIFVLGSCLRRPDEQGHFDQRFALDVYVNEIGPMKLEQPDEWTAAPTFDMIANNQERAASEREVQIARRRLGESLSEDPFSRNAPMLSEDEIQTRADAMARFLGFGRELEQERRERELEVAAVNNGAGDGVEIATARMTSSSDLRSVRVEV